MLTDNMKKVEFSYTFVKFIYFECLYQNNASLLEDMVPCMVFKTVLVF